jgi:Cu(I)/Ag(I) efflux system membrane fusion protein
MKKKKKSIKWLLAIGAMLMLVITSCQQKQSRSAPAIKENEVKYTCPMHPQILEDHPGSCPICGMTLIKKSGQASEGSGINLRTVLQPVNASVISGITAISPVQQEMPTQIQAEGYLDFDTRTFNNIASRYSGRIEKLYIKHAFEEIHVGQRIFDIYSPEMVTAQQDLLFVLKNSPQETGLIYAAQQKLLLLGMTENQVNGVIKTQQPYYSLPVYSPYEGHVHDVAHSQMAGTEQQTRSDYTNNLPLAVKEGMYVEKGENLFNVVDPHMLWALIKIKAADIAALRLNQPVMMTLPDIPGKIINGKVDFIEPILRNGDNTTSIRVYVHNMNHQLKVNIQVRAVIQTGTSNGLWIPKTALFDLGRTKIVWVKEGASFKARQVNTGMISGNDVRIVKGLAATDSLASNAAYLTDSESFIKVESHD